jgi:hypothetical protein
MLLRENSRPAWMLLPGNLHDSKPPLLKPARVWIPTPNNPVQDALLFFAVVGARVPEVRAVYGEFNKARVKNRVDLAEDFPQGLPKQIYETCQKHLKSLHVVVSVGNGSLALADLKALDRYTGLNLDIRTSHKKLR